MTHDFKAAYGVSFLGYDAKRGDYCVYFDTGGSSVKEVGAAIEALRLMAEVQEGRAKIVPVKDRGNGWTVLDEIDLTLKYFDEEFPQSSYPQIWDDPINAHSGGISPNDLEEIKAMLSAASLALQQKWK